MLHVIEYDMHTVVEMAVGMAAVLSNTAALVEVQNIFSQERVMQSNLYGICGTQRITAEDADIHQNHFFFYTDLFPLPPSVSTWSRHSSETLQFRTQRKHNLMLCIATSFFWFTEFISRAAECSLLATEKWLGIRWLDTNFGYKPTRKTPQGWCELCWTWWWQWRGKQISLANMMSSRGAASCWFSPLT